ncbi:uncharacterized protein LOC143036352 [Oratosquilla oratoria]|uniref:uncharacterized protein LOC143036352 n=1 Tax=Oratosquilla oratoria TaxID=337810 RepID=UPI003F770B0E
MHHGHATSMHFLIDTGAARWRQSHQPASNVQLIAVNSTPISTYGRQHLEISIDVTKCQLVDTAFLTISPIAATPTEFALQVVEVTDSFAHLRNAYPDVFKPKHRQQPQTPAKHGICHCIKTSGPPVFSKFRRLAPDKLAAAKQIFAEIERLGICQKASSHWSSPLHIVTKKDGALRPCGDYRHLNNKRAKPQPTAQHRRHHIFSPRLKNLLKTGPSEGVLPGTHAPGRHPKNCCNHALRHLHT